VEPPGLFAVALVKKLIALEHEPMAAMAAKVWLPEKLCALDTLFAARVSASDV
jgi:hypothetical protein